MLMKSPTDDAPRISIDTSVGRPDVVEDPKVQARLLADARTGKLHPSVMTVLMAYAYGRPRDTTTSEPMIPMSEIEDARQSLEIKLQRIRKSR
jgi:hypothetical protein